MFDVIWALACGLGLLTWAFHLKGGTPAARWRFLARILAISLAAPDVVIGLAVPSWIVCESENSWYLIVAVFDWSVVAGLLLDARWAKVCACFPFFIRVPWLWVALGGGNSSLAIAAVLAQLSAAAHAIGLAIAEPASPSDVPPSET
jgi:hypothetical protein